MARRFHPIQSAYMKAKAMYETVREIENECKAKVLASREFYTEPDENEVPERITSPSGDFMMNDSDFTVYCQLVWEELKKHNVRVPDYNTTADYETRPALREAEKTLIDWGYAQMKKLPQYKSNAKELARLHEVALSRIEIKEKIIDLALKLQAI